MAKVFRASNITYSPFEMDMATEDIQEDLKREVGNEHSSEWLIDCWHWITWQKAFWGKSNSMTIFVLTVGQQRRNMLFTPFGYRSRKLIFTTKVKSKQISCLFPAWKEEIKERKLELLLQGFQRIVFAKYLTKWKNKLYINSFRLEG